MPPRYSEDVTSAGRRGGGGEKPPTPGHAATRAGPQSNAPLAPVARAARAAPPAQAVGNTSVQWRHRGAALGGPGAPPTKARDLPQSQGPPATRGPGRTSPLQSRPAQSSPIRTPKVPCLTHHTDRGRSSRTVKHPCPSVFRSTQSATPGCGGYGASLAAAGRRGRFRSSPKPALSGPRTAGRGLVWSFSRLVWPFSRPVWSFSRPGGPIRRGLGPAPSAAA